MYALKELDGIMTLKEEQTIALTAKTAPVVYHHPAKMRIIINAKNFKK